MKRTVKKLFAFIITMILVSCVFCGGVFAAETQYVLSFRPGEGGEFTADAEAYLSSFGETQKSAATGNIFLRVNAGEVLPGDIETVLRSYIKTSGNYYYKSGLAAAGEVTGDETFVAQYGVIKGEGVRFTVNYVDAATGAQLGTPYTGYANDGEEISFGAKPVDGYTVDAQTKTLKVGTDAEISFLYTEIINTVVSTTTTTIDLGSAVSEAQTSGTEAPAQSGEIINDNSTPLDDGTSGTDSSESSTPDEIIDDGQTPLAPGQQTTNNNLGLILGGSGAVLLIAALSIFLIAKKNKKNA